jgi:hypothetical protein
MLPPKFYGTIAGGDQLDPAPSLWWYKLVNIVLCIMHAGFFSGFIGYGASHPLALDMGFFTYHNGTTSATGNVVYFNNVKWINSGQMDVRIANPFFYLVTSAEHAYYVYLAFYRPDVVYEMYKTRSNPYRWMFYTASVCPLLYVNITRVSGNVDVTNIMNGAMCYAAMMFTGYLFETTSSGWYIVAGTAFGLMPMLGDLIRIGTATPTPPVLVIMLIAMTYTFFASFAFVAVVDWYARMKNNSISYRTIDFAYDVLSFSAKVYVGSVSEFVGGL